MDWGMEMRRSAWLAVVLFTLLLVGCRGSTDDAPAAPAGNLDQTQWRLVTLRGDDVLPHVAVTLAFKDGGLYGSDGCNSYNSDTVDTGGGVLHLPQGGMVHTAMSCADDIMAQADRYMDALQQSDRYRIEGQQLTILDASGATLLVFSGQMATLLSDSTWQVTSMERVDAGGGHAAYPLIAGTQMTITFAAQDGRVEGHAGCNQFSGHFSVNGESLSISGIYATEMACPGPAGVMEQEQGFLNDLRHVASWKAAGTTLTLTLDDGRNLELTAQTE